MDLEKKSQLETYGYTIMELPNIDPHFRTKTFIKKPDGTLSAYYDHLWQVPMNLYEGDEVSVPETEVPIPARNTRSHELHAQSFLEGRLVGTIGLILLFVFIGIVVGILFMKAFFATDRNPPPCGERGSVTEITECVKEIIYPDCSGVMFDSCKNEIIDEFEPPVIPEEPWGWLQWAILGIAAVGAIIIVPQILRVVKPPPKK